MFANIDMVVSVQFLVEVASSCRECNVGTQTRTKQMHGHDPTDLEAAPTVTAAHRLHLNLSLRFRFPSPYLATPSISF